MFKKIKYSLYLFDNSFLNSFSYYFPHNVNLKFLSKSSSSNKLHHVPIQNKSNDSKQLFSKKENSLKNKIENHAKEKINQVNNIKLNEVNIEMLPENIFQSIFKKSHAQTPSKENIIKANKELKKHKLLTNTDTSLENINLFLPKLYGDIEEHFKTIGEEQSKPYRELLDNLINSSLPPIPKSWSFQEGWTKYSENGPVSVPYPEEEAIIFDVEICCKDGQLPTLATAASSKYWYCWISKNLINTTSPVRNYYQTDDLIPLESTSSINNTLHHQNKPRIVIGHNVSFDRARIKEQYWLNKTGTRFMDTMSLHVCISGITSFQRNILKSKKEIYEPWAELSSLNSLSEVLKLYCGLTLEKSARNTFVNGTIQEIKDDFQNLTTYCANDVLATFNVIKEMWPLFKERFPHPVTLAGMLELSVAYLPVNSNWKMYLQNAQQTYDDLENESKFLLMRKADKACELYHDEKYKNDLWMWDEDWSKREIKIKKAKKSKKNPSENDQPAIRNELEDNMDLLSMTLKENEISLKNKDEPLVDIEPILSKFCSNIISTKDVLPLRIPPLPGYPAWYCKLCERFKIEDWIPGPRLITTSMQITPKLLGLSWESYPLYYVKGEGWGFLVPFSDEASPDSNIPIKQLINRFPQSNIQKNQPDSDNKLEIVNLPEVVSRNIHAHDYNKRIIKENYNYSPENYQGSGVASEITIGECCWFFKLPHKDGAEQRVGNPLAKDFLNKFSENVLTASDQVAEKVLTIGRMLSYWRNNRERVERQIVVRLTEKELPRHLRGMDMDFGAILPQLVVAGTLTRRAVESTWMTSSNAHKERIASELRSMIQTPPGYSLVGADVDSQELWIAAVLGDAYFAGIHGATPIGWMTLSGSKATGTDMHSVTAKEVGISRDLAKIINYARIYGAGINFAVRFLRQYNPSIPLTELKSKAYKMFSLTKGRRVYKLKEKYKEDLPNKDYKKYEALKIQQIFNLPLDDIFDSLWVDGTESAMFNCLESIANSENPCTPFLSCRLSRALDPDDSRHLPTRVNWVVQSGAVDFLHLMLVSMCWLEPRARFSISFHDEVRYLVPDEARYRTALALHVTNLLARSFCVSRIGLIDLPRSVAFFSSVEIDKCWRKDAHSENITPSNPHGLSKGYNIPLGESLNIHESIAKVGPKALIKGCAKYNIVNK